MKCVKELDPFMCKVLVASHKQLLRLLGSLIKFGSFPLELTSQNKDEALQVFKLLHALIYLPIVLQNGSHFEPFIHC